MAVPRFPEFLDFEEQLLYNEAIRKGGIILKLITAISLSAAAAMQARELWGSKNRQLLLCGSAVESRIPGDMMHNLNV